MDIDMSSSPDPLNDSPTYHGPFSTKSRRHSSPRKSLPPYSSSPKKQTFELDVGDQLTSQKIRVTVEAGDSESEDIYANYTSPNGRKRSSLLTAPAPRNRQMERTTTTTVRVKGLSDTEGESQPVATPKRGRGRPRKSAGTPVPSKKRGRPSTPTPKAAGRRTSLLDLIDDNSASDFDIGSNLRPRNGKGTPRSTSRKGTPRKPTPAAKNQSESEKLASNASNKRGRPRRKALLPGDIQVLEDEFSHANERDDRTDMNNGGALRPINSNSPSKYSTSRSTTTTGDDYEDILIARFDPRDETPRKTGWSSPKIVGTGESSNYHRFSSGEDESLFLNQDGSAEDQHDDRDDGDDDGDGDVGDAGETREFDTIMVSEEFSMISVDSVPSLWAHRSSPAGGIQVDISEERPSNRNLPTQDMETDDQGSTFGTILDDKLEADTETRTQGLRSLSGRISRGQVEDSFASIAGDAPKATPIRKTHISKWQSNDNSGIEDSFSEIAPEVLEAATPGRVLPNARFLAATVPHGDDYEDSFSAIPSVVLDAATPAAKHKESGDSRDMRPRDAEPDKLKVIDSNLGSSRAQKHMSPRLLTPDETPSPPLESLDSSPTSAGNMSSRSAGYVTNEALETEQSISRSHMPSSPPALAPPISDPSAHNPDHQQQNTNTVETPFITFSSPSLPPIQQPREQPSSSQESSESQRPTLSPIARAGRALQDLVVPSEPRSRSQSLGSPFNSPATRKSPSIVIKSHPSPLRDQRDKPLSTLGLSDNLSPYGLQSEELSHTTRQDDPFHNDNTLGSQQTSPEERDQYSLGLPEQRRLSDPIINRRFESLQYDDQMSWQADGATDNSPGSIADGANSSVSPQGLLSDAAIFLSSTKTYGTSARVSTHNATTNISEPVTVNPNRGNSGYHQSDDDDLDLLLETMNSSSTNASHPQEPPKEVLDRPRRSKIPSPWRKNSRRLVYSDELSHISSPVGRTMSVAVQRIESSHDGSNDADLMDLSGYQIPQKANFQPHVRETAALDLSALLGGSPSKPLPVLSTSTRSVPPPVERNSGRPQSGEINRETSSDSIENTLEVEGPFTPIPQKQGFRPRARSELPDVADPSPIKQPSFGLFGRTSKPQPSAPSDTRSASKPLAAKPSTTGNVPVSRITPSRAPASYLYDDSSSVTINTEKENLDFARTLKWTENLDLASSDGHIPFQISPTKSCLRSPLKTPFGNAGPSNMSPSKGVKFVSSSPIPSSPLPLSATTWSNAHWSLLSSIVQAWKPQHFTERHGSADGSESSTGRRRNSTRVISKLLGRRVHSNGISMVLEQWHLEAVDEFRGQVPGWQEKVIALRVFSLLAGEERRMLRAALEHEAKTEVSF